MTNHSQEALDGLLEEFKAQPVGEGYIDIIVSRESYQSLAKALIENGYVIEAISWWEHIVSADQPRLYGMGGPRSTYYSGWFAEICIDLDELPAVGDMLSCVIDIVENKVLGEGDGKLVTFKNTKSLTPAFWLKEDERWSVRSSK